jgi:hypothetical protein
MSRADERKVVLRFCLATAGLLGCLRLGLPPELQHR